MKTLEVKKPEAKAIARSIRMSPHKVRRVADQIRGKSYEEALMILQFMPYKACNPILKLLYSAAANAKNNLKFSNNPDTGRCMPADFCGTLYKEYQTQSNYVFPLPPAKIPQCGTRINYFNTKVNLLPYRQDMQNILY
jgi:hypothetical protein